MYTGLTGLSSFGEAMGVIGDNIANLSTTGFKYSQVNFEDLMAQMVSTGSGPGQEGRGTRISQITPIFSQGSLETSADDVDVAITGTGFLIVKEPAAGAVYYTRDGNFNVNKDGYLVNAHGYRVQGKQMVNGTPSGVDQDITISQNYSPPQDTTTMDMVLNLDSTTAAGGTYSSAISVYDTMGTSHTLNLTYTKQAGVAAVDSVTTGAGNTAGLAGSYWTISNPTTDYYVWYTVDGAGANPAPVGRTGIPVAVLSTDTAAQVATKTAAAIAAASGTPFTASAVGAAVTITDTANGPATAPAAGTSPAGWGTFAQTTTGVGNSDWRPSAMLDGTTVIPITDVGSATLSDMVFGDTGQMTSTGTYSLNFSSSGFVIGDPVNHLVTLNLNNTKGGSTTQFAASSVTNYASQDGYGPGYLQRVSINNEGIITGSYSNGQITPLYQLTLARFNAPTKLHREGSNMYTETQDSGVPLTGAPSTNGLGSITSNSLEQSNTDLSDQFVHMIIYQRDFQANSRIITTSDTLLEEVLSLKR